MLNASRRGQSKPSPGFDFSLLSLSRMAQEPQQLHKTVSQNAGRLWRESQWPRISQPGLKYLWRTGTSAQGSKSLMLLSAVVATKTQRHFISCSQKKDPIPLKGKANNISTLYSVGRRRTHVGTHKALAKVLLLLPRAQRKIQTLKF